MNRIETEALVVRSVPYRETDSVVTLFTASHGVLGVMIRGARKSTKRVGGALEPFHTIAVTVEDRGGELCTLKEARLVRMRHGLVSSLEALDAAGTVLRWARHLLPARHPEPEAWRIVSGMLDALDGKIRATRPLLLSTGFRLLAAVGYGLELERCVRCGKACPPNRPSFIDAARGGLVCRECGGAQRVMDPEERAIAMALARGEDVELGQQEGDELLALIDEAMAAHGGFEK